MYKAYLQQIPFILSWILEAMPNLPLKKCYQSTNI
jgi:hypothetical protein